MQSFSTVLALLLALHVCHTANIMVDQGLSQPSVIFKHSVGGKVYEYKCLETPNAIRVLLLDLASAMSY